MGKNVGMRLGICRNLVGFVQRKRGLAVVYRCPLLLCQVEICDGLL